MLATASCQHRPDNAMFAGLNSRNQHTQFRHQTVTSHKSVWLFQKIKYFFYLFLEVTSTGQSNTMNVQHQDLLQNQMLVIIVFHTFPTIFRSKFYFFW